MFDTSSITAFPASLDVLHIFVFHQLILIKGENVFSGTLRIKFLYTIKHNDFAISVYKIIMSIIYM